MPQQSTAETYESSNWVRATPLARLKEKGRIVFRLDGRQVALFDTPQGVRACNNRCPHEGYPLSEGTLEPSCVLTCNWHNWKFDLATGENVYQGDRLRVYPVEIRGDDIWIDLSDPPFDVRRAEIFANLREAFDDNVYDRMARELGRLRLLGADPLDATREAIRWSHDRMEFGWTHAYAGLADWLTLYDEHEQDPETQLICLLEGIGHIADDVLRETTYPFGDERRQYGEDEFVEAVEREDEHEAIAMIRGALTDGQGFKGLERGLTRAALAHYNDFGHSLIYITKTETLIERLGEAVAEPLLMSLVRGFIFAFREDRIPEFHGYAAALDVWGVGAAESTPDASAFRKLGIDKSLKLTAKSGRTDAMDLYYALLGANASNMLAFDADQQHKVQIPISDNVGWLDFTHGITFANAVRRQCAKFPELWPRGLLQMACFSGRNAAFTHRQPDLNGWVVADAAQFFVAAIRRLFDHGLDEFIVSVHLLKTILAAREESRAAPNDVAELVLAAVNRFLNTPLKRKQVRRTAYQAMQFVARDG